MSVYFVYRSHSDNPGAFHVKVFPQDTVLEWFQSIWKGIPQDRGDFTPPFPSNEYAEELLGQHVYSFGGLFRDMHEHQIPPPRTIAQLAGARCTTTI